MGYEHDRKTETGGTDVQTTHGAPGNLTLLRWGIPGGILFKLLT